MTDEPTDRPPFFHFNSCCICEPDNCRDHDMTGCLVCRTIDAELPCPAKVIADD